MAKEVLPPFYKGESGKGSYDTLGYSVTENLDVHSQLGTTTCQVSIASESTTPNQASIGAIVSNGDTFWASTTSGKIWKRTSAGVYSLVHTNTQGNNCGIAAFQGYLYYWSATKIGRITIALASSESTWSSQNDSYGTFTNGSSYKPYSICNLSLFIGDGNYVARIDYGHTFSANVLDVESQYSITAIENADGWLLLGLTLSTSVCFSKVVLWDTYSSSWTYEDDLYEIGISAFIVSDNIIFILAGTTGNIYYWTGAKAQFYAKIPSLSTAVSINPYNVAILGGKALFAIGTRIYSIHKSDKDMPYSIVEEFTLSSGTAASILVKGSDLLVSNGSAIFKTGTDKATAKITSSYFQETFNEVTVPYESMPAGCSIGLETNCNNTGWVTETNFEDDTTNMRYQLIGAPTFDGVINFYKLRFTLNPVTSTAPVIKQPIIHM